VKTTENASLHCSAGHAWQQSFNRKAYHQQSRHSCRQQMTRYQLCFVKGKKIVLAHLFQGSQFPTENVLAVEPIFCRVKKFQSMPKLM
jgi:hypothetical protein